MVTKQESASVSAAGVVAALIFLLGLGAMLYNPVLGVLIIIASFILGTIGRGKTTVLICPACRHRIEL